MNPKTTVAFSIVAIAAVIVLFATGPLAATKAQAFPFGGFHRGFGFHHYGFGFHRHFFGFGFHRHFFPGFGFGGFGGCGGCC